MNNNSKTKCLTIESMCLETTYKRKVKVIISAEVANPGDLNQTHTKKIVNVYHFAETLSGSIVKVLRKKL